MENRGDHGAALRSARLGMYGALAAALIASTATIFTSIAAVRAQSSMADKQFVRERLKSDEEVLKKAAADIIADYRDLVSTTNAVIVDFRNNTAPTPKEIEAFDAALAATRRQSIVTLPVSNNTSDNFLRLQNETMDLEGRIEAGIIHSQNGQPQDLSNVGFILLLGQCATRINWTESALAEDLRVIRSRLLE